MRPREQRRRSRRRSAAKFYAVITTVVRYLVVARADSLICTISVRVPTEAIIRHLGLFACATYAARGISRIMPRTGLCRVGVGSPTGEAGWTRHNPGGILVSFPA